MYGYIYITTNTVNNKKYIGQHKGQFDTSYLGSGKLIKRAVLKYGKDSFAVRLFCWCKTKEELGNIEYIVIDELNAVKDNAYYNLADGGTGSGFISHSQESKDKISNWHKGKPTSEITKKKMSLASPRRKLTTEEKAHIGNCIRGNKSKTASSRQHNVSYVKRLDRFKVGLRVKGVSRSFGSYKDEVTAGLMADILIACLYEDKGVFNNDYSV